MSEQRQMLRNSRVMSIVTAVSRVFGLLREGIIAWLLGTTRMADVWNLAFLIPNLFRRFLAEGAMSSAFVPLLSELRAEGDEIREREFARAFFSLILVVSVVLTTLMVVALPWVLPWIISVFSVRPVANTAQLLAVAPAQLMFPYLVFISLAAVCQGMLNVRNRYALPAATPIVLNVAIITCGVAFRNVFDTPLWGLCIGVLIGGFCQFFLQWLKIFRMGLHLVPTVRIWHDRTREALRLWLPITLAAGIYQINVLVSQTISFNLFAGAMASLNYSNRIMELVLGIFAAAMSTSLLPTLSKQRTLSDRRNMVESLGRSLEFVSFVTIPAAVGLLLCSYSLIWFLFGHGRFDEHSLLLTYGVILFHAMALVPIAWYRVLSQTFFAFKKVAVSVWLSTLATVTNISLCLVLPRWFPPSVSHCGIALATLCYAWVLIVACRILIRRMFRLELPVTLYRELFKILAASLAMVPVWWPFRLEVLSLTGFTVRIIASIALYLGIAWLLRIRGLWSFLEMLPGQSSGES